MICREACANDGVVVLRNRVNESRLFSERVRAQHFLAVRIPWRSRRMATQQKTGPT